MKIFLTGMRRVSSPPRVWKCLLAVALLYAGLDLTARAGNTDLDAKGNKITFDQYQQLFGLDLRNPAVAFLDYDQDGVFADGIDNEGITVEDDPQVANNMANNSVPRWNSAITQLVTSGIYYDPVARALSGTEQLHIQAGTTVNPMLYLNPWNGITMVGGGGGCGFLNVRGRIGIGIGATVPITELEVEGNAWIKNNLYLGDPPQLFSDDRIKINASTSESVDKFRHG